MKRSVPIILMIGYIIVLLPFIKAAVGLSPGSYTLDFFPGLQKDLYFTFLFDSNTEAEISAVGALKDYVTLSTNKIKGTALVQVSLKLPNKIEKPGDNTVEIVAKQIEKGSGGVHLVGNVIGVITVKVPYPGKYAEISLATTDANAGDDINISVYIDNKGSETVIAKSKIKIVDSTNKTLEERDIGAEVVETKTLKVNSYKLSTVNYKPGDYRAIAIVDYGVENPVVREKSFRLGRLYVGISNYTKEFVKGGIAKLDIEVESFWNDPIDNLYATVRIINHTIDFTTPSVQLEPWEKKYISGFFDSSLIEENSFKANITVYYFSEKTNQIVDLKFIHEINYLAISIITGIVVVVLLLVATIIFLFRKLRKSKVNYGRNKK